MQNVGLYETLRLIFAGCYILIGGSIKRGRVYVSSLMRFSHKKLLKQHSQAPQKIVTFEPSQYLVILCHELS